MNNPSPGFISLFAAFIASMVPSIILSVQEYRTDSIIFIFLLTFVFSFSIFYYLLNFFIYKKIKLIYRNIFRFKSNSPVSKESGFNFREDPLLEVEKDVMEWMKDNRKEIDQLKEQETFRREFIGNVSHELKTPIQSVQGYIHTLLDGALEDKAVNRKFLEKARKGSDRLARLVHDLTMITELQSGKQALDISKFDLIPVIHAVIEMLEERIEEKNMDVTFAADSPTSLVVKADKGKIEQLVTNLLVNAVKYGRRDGNVEIAFETLSKQVLVEISDDGEGIAKEHLPRLFERFYRTDTGRSRDEGGSGLGLAIVKHIVEQHQQSINVRSTKGEGTTFGFTLEKA